MTDLRTAMAEVITVVNQIDAAYLDGEPNRSIQCPRCGAPITYTKIENGHRAAACTSETCGFDFME